MDFFETKGRWKGRTVDEDASAARHVELTRQAIHPMTAPCRLSPQLETVIVLKKLLGPRLRAWRQIIVEELQVLKEIMGPETQRWKDSLSPHIQEAYRSKGMSDFPWPLLKKLLEIINYPPPPT